MKCEICLKEFEDSVFKECVTEKYNVCDECCINDCCDKCKTIVIMRKQLAELRDKLRWISVSERLPEKNGVYETKQGEKQNYQIVLHWFFKGTDTWISHGVEFWREVPEL